MKICCIGAGHVGGPTMAVIAKNCPQFTVTIVDINVQRIDAWNSSKLPVYEPGLDDVVQLARGRNLFFSTDVEKAVYEADVIFISVHTPTKEYGVGAGKAPDMTYVENCARMIARVSDSDKIIVEKSTVPVKTAETIKRILETSGTNQSFEVLSNPEFLAEGTAVKDLESPDRVLIGAEETERGRKALDVVVNIYSKWVPREKILTTNVWSAELSKLSANAFLAQRISSINSISAVCEATGANVKDVSASIGADERIGSAFLNASVGFGGSCFKKDILNLVYLCEHYGLHVVAQYWESVLEMNEYQMKRFSRNIVKRMFDSVSGKRIAVLGFAFKKNTNDTRESAAISVCRDLIEEQANLALYDPQVTQAQVLKDLGVDIGVSSVDVCEDAYTAARDSDAVVVLTEWDEFKELDFQRIYKSMRSPAFVFDGRGILDRAVLKKIGFDVYVIGQSDDSPVEVMEVVGG